MASPMEFLFGAGPPAVAERRRPAPARYPPADDGHFAPCGSGVGAGGSSSSSSGCRRRREGVVQCAPAKSETSFLFNLPLPGRKTSPRKSARDVERETIKAFYEETDTKPPLVPVLPRGWKEYKDKNGLLFFGGRLGGRMRYQFDKPPLPPHFLSRKPCKGVDLVRFYQSPGILGTNLFNNCKLRCDPDDESEPPSMVPPELRTFLQKPGQKKKTPPALHMVFREPVQRIRVRIVNKSYTAPQESLWTPDRSGDRVLYDMRFKLARKGVLDKSARPVGGSLLKYLDMLNATKRLKSFDKIGAMRAMGVGQASEKPKDELNTMQHFCVSKDDPLPRRYEITVNDLDVDPSKNGDGTDFIGRVTFRAYARDGSIYHFPGDLPSSTCSIL